MIELMIDSLIVVGLAVLGAAMGSFAAAQVWRLRVRQLAYDADHGETVSRADAAEVRLLSKHKRSVASDRSQCLHCGHQLRWYELLPVASWLLQRGKCRSCGKPIGTMELYAEVCLGVVFAVSYVVWPHGFTALGTTLFVIWLVVLVVLAMQWMYDAKWFLLLDHLTLLLLVAALLGLALQLASQPTQLLGASLLDVGLILLVLPGFYGLLYVISRGAWIGLGDVKMLVPFALMLPSWEYGVLLLFLANLIGCVALLPALLTKKLSRTTRVPFGPFLIMAFVVAYLIGGKIINIYLGTIFF